MGKVQDSLNNLISEIKNSEEYIKYRKIKELINNDEILKKRVDKFEQARYEAQVLTIRGEQPTEYQIELMQNLYIELMENEITKKFVDAELEFNTLLSEVNKTLGDAIRELM